jgi:hypothetical protein
MSAVLPVEAQECETVRVLAKALRAYDCSLYELLKELSLKRKLKNEESCTQSVDHDASRAGTETNVVEGLTTNSVFKLHILCVG